MCVRCVCVRARVRVCVCVLWLLLWLWLCVCVCVSGVAGWLVSWLGTAAVVSEWEWER